MTGNRISPTGGGDQRPEGLSGEFPSQTTIDDLARLLFLENDQLKPVTLSVPSIADSKGLFLFCVDLLKRGLLLSYTGSDGEPRLPGTTPLPVHDISHAMFSKVSRQMECAGIRVNKTSVPSPERESSSVVDGQLPVLAAGDDLKDFVIRLDFRGIRHDISFAIVRPTDGKGSCGTCTERF